jgi:hypothetical protein
MNRKPALPPKSNPRDISRPRASWWLMRIVKDGPSTVPARIYWTDAEPGEPSNKLDRWPLPFLAAEIAGKVADIDDIWSRRGVEIDEQEFNYRMADMNYARDHAPAEPIANPTRKVDIRSVPIPF